LVTLQEILQAQTVFQSCGPHVLLTESVVPSVGALRHRWSLSICEFK
jgi:hypothetical protein